MPITHFKTYSLETNTKRGAQFLAFAKEVKDHVDNYSVDQYGDMPDDMVETWTSTHVIQQMEKYLTRMKRDNGRGDDDNILSCKKIAHYACILESKLREGK